MRKSSWIALGIILAIAAALGYGKLSEPPPPDADQIRDLLARGEAAIEARNVNAAMSCVSGDYRDSTGLSRDALRLQVARAFRQVEGYDLSVMADGINPEGGRAEVTVRVILSAVENGTASQVFSGPVTISLRKEQARRYLVLPTRAWKVVGMAGLPLGGEML